MPWHVPPVTSQLGVAAGHTVERMSPTVAQVQNWMEDTSESQSVEMLVGYIRKTFRQVSLQSAYMGQPNYDMVAGRGFGSCRCHAC